MEEELCLCEYAREGQTKHLCDCEDLDRLADEAMSSWCSCCCSCCEEEQDRQKRPVERDKALRRLLAIADERARLPFPGGARKVNAGLITAPLVLGLAHLACNLSDWLPWAALCLGLVGAKLVWFHLACLRLLWRTDYFISWVFASIAGLYGDYARLVLPVQGWLGMLAMHLILLMVLATYASAVLQRPKAAMASALPGSSSSLPRSYHCRLCGCNILRRDHHCVWINQCVGAHNHRAFVGFVASFAVMCLCYAYLALAALADASALSLLGFLAEVWASGRLSLEAVGALYAGVGGVLVLSLTVGQVRSVGLGLTMYEQLKLAKAKKSQVSDKAKAAAAAAAAGDEEVTRLLGRCHAWQQHPFDSGGVLQNWKAWCSGECYGELDVSNNRFTELVVGPPTTSYGDGHGGHDA